MKSYESDVAEILSGSNVASGRAAVNTFEIYQ